MIFNTILKDILNKSNDGFYIAGEDLKLRGPGDLFGIRQSGDMEFRIGDIYNDSAILKSASKLLLRFCLLILIFKSQCRFLYHNG